MDPDSQIIIPIPEDKVFYLQEHEPFKPEFLPYISSLNLEFVETEYEGEPKYLGITPDMRASYYIGADWLTSEKAIVVTPKMPDIDYVKMFMSALRFAPSASYFSKFYGINYSGCNIESKELDSILTPLLLIHFLSAVNKLLEKGLKKGYVMREENLQAKIKGKVMLSKHYSKNIANHRADKIMCCYQEYSADIPENRLIKKALLFAKRSISILPALLHHKIYPEINHMLLASLAAFDGVSDNIDVSCVRMVQKNKLFGDYGAAIKLAKQLLKRYDFSINNIKDVENKVPPFWIDMSRLYEVYVYGLLQKTYPGQIKFQVKGHYNTAVDFLKIDEGLIMDTKYKPYYDTSNSGIINDIREISGYARDEAILGELGFSDMNDVPNCIIIYPKMEDCRTVNAFSEGELLLLESTPITGFRRFYKICVPVPTLKASSLACDK